MYKEIIKKDAKLLGYKPILTYMKPEYPSYEERKSHMRPVSIGNNKEKSIAIFGCSFAYGSFLSDDETFSAYLSKYTGRTVYNRALYATGFPFFYYQLQDKDIEKEIQDPKYIIYVLINDHFVRSLTNRSWCKDPAIQHKYILKRNKLTLVEPKFEFLYPLYSVFLFQKAIQNIQYKLGLYKDIFIALIDESNKIIKQKFPEAEFIILVYQDAEWKRENNETKNEILKHFEHEGINVIYTDDLLGENTLDDTKYRVSDGHHPSSIAWDLISRKLSEKLKI